MKRTLLIISALVFVLSAGSNANSIDSATLVFNGTLTDNGNGTFTGTIPMTAGQYYVTGGAGQAISVAGGFDVYARAGDCAYVQGYYGTGPFNCGSIDTYRIGADNDAYPGQLTGRPWGSWHNPDCADWDKYELQLTADHWYLRYSMTAESPMSGTMDWANMYASESDLGTQSGGNGGSAVHGGGPAAWDWDCGWGVEVIPLELPGFLVDVNDIGGGNFKVTLTLAPQSNTLLLDVKAPSLYVKPSENAIIDMEVMNLAQKINGCQAMLGYSSTYFPNPASGVVIPGGGVWDLVIYDSWDVGNGISGEIDTAIGIDVQSTVMGTNADGTVAKIVLKAGNNEGSTELIFRPDEIDNELKQTMLSDLFAQPVWPYKLNSQTIIIDGTAPDVNIISAKQSGQELISTSINAVQGPVNIQVTASDALAGIAGPPIVTVTPQGGSAENAVFVSHTPVGTFNYTWTISSTTPNGTAIINASVEDKAGNIALDSNNFNVNRNQITGTVSMDTLSHANYSFNRVVKFKATDSMSAVIKTWDITVTFTNAPVLKIASGSYVLTDVPFDTVNLSAKTNWSLRQRKPVNFDPDMQAVGDFMLLGGDMNNTNTTTVLDYSILKVNWMTNNTVADLSGDNQVNILDYSILKKNFFKNGDNE